MNITAHDNGNETVNVTGNEPDARSQMLASASAIASFVVETEGKLADTAKTWGHNIFRAVYVDGLNLDALIGDSKVAAGWNTLTASEAGKKAKARLEVYFSNARLVAERYSSLTDEVKADIVAGLSSIHYLAGQMRKADADAKKAEKKEAARIAAEAAAEKAKEEAEASSGNVIQTEPQPQSLASLVEAVLTAYQLASDDEKNEAYPALEMLVNAMNADIEAATAPLVEMAEAA